MLKCIYFSGPSTRLVETRACQHGPCWQVMETGHPSTRAVNSGSGNRSLPSVCPPHKSETNDPKLGIGPWDILVVTWIWGWKVKVTGSISHFRTNSRSTLKNEWSKNVQTSYIWYPRNDMVLGLTRPISAFFTLMTNANAHLSNNSNTTWVWTLWVPSSVVHVCAATCLDKIPKLCRGRQ